MTVQISNTELNSSFNAWRLNTNFAATVISNNVVTVSRAGSANRGGVAKGNGHVAGTFSANELRTSTLKAGNTTADGGWLYVNSNTSINATSLTVTSNTTFQGNIVFATSGTDRFIMGDISRVRVTGGSKGQFMRIETQSDTPEFKFLTLRDITDLSTNSAHIILSGSNSTFSDNADSPHLIFAGATGGADRVEMFLAAGTVTESDLYVKLVDAGGDSTLAVADSSNNRVAYITSAGQLFATANVNTGSVTANGNILPGTDDSIDLGAPNREFRNLYVDGVANIDELSVATGASQGVATSLIPKTDAVGNLGSTTRKWGTVWADTTNGGAGVFKTLGVSGTLTVNGDITINSDNMTLVGNTVIGDAATDTVTFTAQVDSDFDPQTGSQRDMGSTSNRWHNIYANNVIANNITTDNNTTINGDLTVNGSTTIASGQVLVVDDGIFNTLGVTGTLTANGNVDLGNATTDSITVTGQFDSALIPITDDTYDLGTVTKQWQDIWIDGTASIDVLAVDETSTFTGVATFNNNIDLNGDLDVSGDLSNEGTLVISSNGKVYANNAISNKTILTTMIANTMSSGSIHGGASQVPVIRVNDRGQVIGISNTSVASISGLTYTQSNNNIRISTATGTTYDDTIDVAGTGTAVKGVASFQAGDFSLSSGHVSLADTANGAVLAISGTANEVNVSRTNGTVTVGLPDDVTVTGQLNVGENVIVAGNLIVSGTTTTVNSETVNIADNIIVLNSNETDTPSQNGGFTIERGTSTNYSFLWNETDDRWTLGDRNLVANTFIGNLDGTAELANTAVKLQTARYINLSGDVAGNVTFDGTGTATMTTTIQADSVALGTDTTGNYMVDVSAGSGIDVSHTPGEGSTATISIEPDLRDGITHIGLDTTDYIGFTDNSSQIHYVNAVERLRVDTAGIDVTGAITATGTISASSDARIKDNVEPISNALEKVQAITGVTFDRNDMEDSRQTGVIAQDVEAVLPEAVRENEEGMKTVAYGNMVGLLIEAIKELQAEIDELKKNK